MFNRVLLCYDGTPAARSALKRGAELAALVKARVYVLSIVSDPVPSAAVMAGAVGSVCVVDSEAELQESIRESVECLKGLGVEAQGFLARGNTIDAIVECSKRLAVDLIVVGHYPKPSGGRWWSGAERTALAERVNCCVLIAVDVDTSH
jgi:nucleotide-binding universal stress UspA family protein